MRETTTLADFQQRVGQWAAETFPDGTDDGTLEHLRWEVEELAVAMERGGADDVEEEIADCFILLCNLASRRGFDLMTAGEHKQGVNERREWGEPDAAGVIEHVRP